MTSGDERQHAVSTAIVGGTVQPQALCPAVCDELREFIAMVRASGPSRQDLARFARKLGPILFDGSVMPTPRCDSANAPPVDVMDELHPGAAEGFATEVTCCHAKESTDARCLLPRARSADVPH